MAMVLIRSSPASAPPIWLPRPGTKLNAPSGRSTSAITSARTAALIGVLLAGLRTMLLPAASAGAICSDVVERG